MLKKMHKTLFKAPFGRAQKGGALCRAQSKPSQRMLTLVWISGIARVWGVACPQSSRACLQAPSQGYPVGGKAIHRGFPWGHKGASYISRASLGKRARPTHLLSPSVMKIVCRATGGWGHWEQALEGGSGHQPQTRSCIVLRQTLSFCCEV